MTDKHILKSKTFWANLIMFVLACIPDLREFLGTIEGTDVATVWLVQLTNLLNIALRILTKGPVSARLDIAKNAVRLFFGKGVK